MGDTMLKALVILSALCGCLSIPIENKIAKEDLTKYRLPQNVVPEKYKLFVAPYFPQLETATESIFDGHVEITANVVADNVNKITLHANDMIIKDVVLKNDKEVLLEQTPDYSDMEKYDFIHIITKNNLTKGSQVVIRIEYSGNMRSDMDGFYLSSYKDKNNVTQWLGATQFEPVYARRAFPCFDEPHFKANFTVQIQCPEGYKPLSNMKLQIIDENIYVYEESAPMPTYLVAFVVSKFDDTKSVNETFNVWSRPEAKSQSTYAASVGWNLLSNMSDYMNINYYTDMKMLKMDMVALPDFKAGAMENWGLITYRETDLLVDSVESTKKDKQRVASVIAHELTHQWFGDYVTLDWWSNTWLNEGFATFFEYFLTNMVEPTMDMMDQFVVDEVQTAMAADSLLTAQPLTNIDSYTKNQINADFGLISYNKGGSVLRMIQHVMGEENFRKSLHDYIASRNFSNSIPSNLWTSMDNYKIDNSKINVSQFVENWFNQSGYPILKATWNGTVVKLTQERFLFPHAKSNYTSKPWYIPVSYTNGSANELVFTSTTPKIIIKPSDNETVININKDDVILLNLQSTGYYRVLYDAALLKRIKQVLVNSSTTEKIHYLNRAMLVSDVLNLARAGKMKYETSLDFLTYLSNEVSYYPWSSAFEGFRFLLQRFTEKDAEGKGLRAYILGKMEKLLKNNNFDNKTTKYIDTYNKVNALKWACDLGHKDYIKTASDIFQVLKNGTVTVIPADLRDVVYCSAIRNGNSDDWTFLWQKFLKSNVASEKVRILNALGCSTNKTILNEYLQMSVTEGSGIRKQDAMYAFSAVYTGNYEGVGIALKFLQDNFRDISDNYGGLNALGNAIAGLASRLTKEEEVKQLEDFLNSNLQSLKDVEASGKDSITQARANLKWSQDYRKDIANYLGAKKNGATAVTTSILSIVLAVIMLLRQAF